MYCNNCKKIVDDDSKFCVYCGNNSFSKTEYEDNKNEKKQDDLQEELLKEKHFTNYLLAEKNKYKILLSIFLPILIIAILLLSIFLTFNTKEINKIKSQVSSLESQKNDLLNESKSILNANNSLESDLIAANNNYNSLKEDYDNLSSQYSNKEESIGSNPVNNSSGTSTNSEVAFFDKVYNLINEYNLAINHMNVYHGEEWIINDPQSVALEETFIVKLNELYEQLVNFSYPNTLENERNNLVNISKEIYNIKVQQVEYMRNNDYSNYVKYNDLFNNTMQKFRDYYNSMIK